MPAGTGVMSLVGGSNLRYANGFVCYPNGLPKDPHVNGRRLLCTPVGGDWYIWEYER
jgi:hypothetical protein